MFGTEYGRGDKSTMNRSFRTSTDSVVQVVIVRVISIANTVCSIISVIIVVIGRMHSTMYIITIVTNIWLQ